MSPGPLWHKRILARFIWNLGPEKAEAHREEILELLPACKGNLIRVHEKLLDRGAALSYQALTGFCRRHGIGCKRPIPSGQCDFEPGEEMRRLGQCCPSSP